MSKQNTLRAVAVAQRTEQSFSTSEVGGSNTDDVSKCITTVTYLLFLKNVPFTVSFFFSRYNSEQKLTLCVDIADAFIQTFWSSGV